jgi:hypothetical protein
MPSGLESREEVDKIAIKRETMGLASRAKELGSFGVEGLVKIQRGPL